MKFVYPAILSKTEHGYHVTFPDLTGCEADGETGCCWAIIRHLYEKWHIAIPKPIQAFISIPEVWEAFLRMTAEQLNILLASDMEGEPFP